jgi:DNA replication protein DnaC
MQSSNQTTPVTASTRSLSSDKTLEAIDTRLARFAENRRVLEAQWLRDAMVQRAKDARQEEEERKAFHGDCFRCRDTGYVHHPINHHACDCPRGRAVIAEYHRIVLAGYWKQVDVPPRCVDYSLASYPIQQSRALARIRDFLTAWDGKRGLILTGAYGTGKTGLMVGMLREVAAKYVGSERRIQFVTTTDLMDALRDAIAAARAHKPQADAKYSAILDRAKQTTLLAVDDLGAEKPTAFVQERLFAIFNYRYEHLRPTFATTNYGLEQLATRITQRVVDRLLETCDVLAVEGPNLRQQQRGGG